MEETSCLSICYQYVMDDESVIVCQNSSEWTFCSAGSLTKKVILSWKFRWEINFANLGNTEEFIILNPNEKFRFIFCCNAVVFIRLSEN